MGAKRHCLKFKKVSVTTTKKNAKTGKHTLVKKMAFRCIDYKQGRGHPRCTPGKLSGGGRSQVFIRPGNPPCTKAER